MIAYRGFLDHLYNPQLKFSSRLNPLCQSKNEAIGFEPILSLAL